MKVLFHIKMLAVSIMVFTCQSDLLGQVNAKNSMDSCNHLMGSEYISDGQEYIASLDENNVARFHTTFYGGSRYRIIACSDIEDHPLILKVLDTEQNVLFNNKKHAFSPYWNLVFTSTVNCVVVIEVESEQKVNRPVKLLIGFKERPTDFY